MVFKTTKSETQIVKEAIFTNFGESMGIHDISVFIPEHLKDDVKKLSNRMSFWFGHTENEDLIVNIFKTGVDKETKGKQSNQIETYTRVTSRFNVDKIGYLWNLKSTLDTIMDWNDLKSVTLTIDGAAYVILKPVSKD